MTTDTRRRVKLYALNAERQWDDRFRLNGKPMVNILFIQIEGYDFVHSLPAILKMEIFLAVFFKLKDGFTKKISSFIDGQSNLFCFN